MNTVNTTKPSSADKPLAGLSLLGYSLGRRLGMAGVIIALLWLAVLWALQN